MSKWKQARNLYRIFRHCNPPLTSLRLVFETLRTTN
jgi:hypothetical protein